MLAGRLGFYWATTRMVSDDRAKGLGLANDDELMWSKLLQIVEPPTRELQLVSAYFVPEAEGTESLAALARQGVRIAILTNSL